MSRRFRGLPAWCALKSYGRQGYTALVRRCVDNALLLGAKIEAADALELLAPVNLNIVCFRYAPRHLHEAARDAFNTRAIQALQRDGRAFVTPTTWEGKGAIRAAFDNWATTPADVEILWTALTEVGEALINEG
jgi:glutamate/tyrosine decarboxylase-like PLP-dependent enzyme